MARPTKTPWLSPGDLLTLVVLGLTVATGVVSGLWGFNFGRRALRGVTQPTALSLTWNTTAAAQTSAAPTPLPRGQMPLLDEKQLITVTDARLKLIQTGASGDPNKASAGILPQTISAQGVTLDVQAVRQDGGDLVLDVQLQNRGDRTVRFLYDLLKVSDDRGQPVTARAQDLPAELPADGESRSGSIRIASSQLQGAKTLSLQLPDYPDQRLRLEVSNIPAQSGAAP